LKNQAALLQRFSTLPGAYKVQMINALEHLCDLNAHDFIIKSRTSFIFTEDVEDEENENTEENNNNNNNVTCSIDSNKNTKCENTHEEDEEYTHLDEHTETNTPSTRTNELLTSANSQQRFLANFFRQYLRALMQYEQTRRRFKHASKPLPFHIVVNGLAGSGKSYVISIIEQMLTDFCISESAIHNRPRRRKGLLKMAHTGKAALNILGCTIHTALGMVKFQFISYSK
jgi:hypothetical protein